MRFRSIIVSYYMYDRLVIYIYFQCEKLNGRKINSIHSYMQLCVFLRGWGDGGGGLGPHPKRYNKSRSNRRYLQ